MRFLIELETLNISYMYIQIMKTFFYRFLVIQFFKYIVILFDGIKNKIHR